MLALHVLASGSKGNAAIVEETASGRGILIDCGICKRDVFARCVEAHFDLSKLDAIFVTHDHSDHTKCLGVVTRGMKKHGTIVPLYALPEVIARSKEISELDSVLEIRELKLREPLVFGSLTVQPFATSHDAAASCGFRFSSADSDTLGYLTDSGCLTEDARDTLRGVRILALEANHDEKMLRNGEYPGYLKERILSDKGHLSNAQAADALGSLASDKLECVIAMHISENNNLPSLAKAAFQQTLDFMDHPARVLCAAQGMLVSVR